MDSWWTVGRRALKSTNPGVHEQAGWGSATLVEMATHGLVGPGGVLRTPVGEGVQASSEGGCWVRLCR